MSNLTDEAVHDAKQGAKAVSSTVHAVKQGVKDAKVIGKARDKQQQAILPVLLPPWFRIQRR